MSEHPNGGVAATYAVGTPTSPDRIAELFGIEIEDVEEVLLDHNVETCPGCGWWVDSSEMMEAEHGDMVCSDCADPEEDDP